MELHASDGADSILVSTEDGLNPGARTLTVDGLGPFFRIFSTVAADDRLAVDGGPGDDTLQAADGVTDHVGLALQGGADNDRLIGSNGPEVLDGGLGNDTVTGGGGVDSFLDDGGVDRIVETRDADFQLSDTTLTIDSETETLGGIFEEAVLTGGDGSNTLTVGDWSGSAMLDGDGADDAYIVNLTGSNQGTTTINDTGGTGGDTATVNGTSGADVFSLDIGQVTLGTATETVIYSGVEALAVNTGAGPDTVTVNSNSVALSLITGDDDDTILVRSAAGGSTVIDGGGGSDHLTGPDTDNTWNITADNGGDLIGGPNAFQFSSVENLTGAHSPITSSSATARGSPASSTGAQATTFWTTRTTRRAS